MSSCPSNYYPNSTSNTCKSCDPSCYDCTGPSNSVCSQCNSGYYLSGSTCGSASACPSSTYPNSNTNTCTSKAFSLFLLVFNFFLQKIGCSSPCNTCSDSSHCTTCISNYYLQPNGYQCSSTCPTGHYPNTTTLACSGCTNPCTSCTGPAYTQCTAGCPSGCATCTYSSTITCTSCFSGYYLSGVSCVNPCPSGTYGESSNNTCVNCSSGCMNCTASGCSACQNSMYLYNNTCYLSCPPYTFTSYDQAGDGTCLGCDSSCLTCSGPGPQNCTLCQTGEFLYNSQCYAQCPTGTYETKAQVSGGIQAPVCASKILLLMTLQLTTDARQVLILFSSSVGTSYLDYFISVLQATLQSVVLDTSQFDVSIVDAATLNLTLLTQDYYPNGAPLRVDLLLDSSFDTDPTNEYSFPVKNATIGLAAYYPYTQAQSDSVTTSSQASSAASTATSAAQAAMVATGGLASTLMAFRLITDLIQILQFLDINWPANVMDLFQLSYIDPSNLCIPTCFFPSPPSNQLPNMTLSSVLASQQISPLYMSNNCQILSTSIIGIVITLLFNLILKFERPKIIPQKLANVGAVIDKMLAWNVIMQVFISNYPLFFGYSLLQFYYTNFDTLYTTAGSLCAIGSCAYCTFFIMKTLRLAWKYSKECKHENFEADKYHRVACLFEGMRKEKRIQIFFIPLSLLRIWLVVVIVMTLSEYPWYCITIILLIQTSFLLYLMRYCPLESKFEYLCNVAAEALLLGAFACAMAVNINTAIDGDEDSMNEIGFIFVSINFAVSIVTMLIVAKQLFELAIWGFKKAKSGYQKAKSWYQTRKHKVMPIATRHDSLTIQTVENKPVSIRKIESALDQIKQAESLLRQGVINKDKNNERVQIPDRAKVEALLKTSLKMVTDSRSAWKNLSSEPKQITLPTSSNNINLETQTKENMDDFALLEYAGSTHSGIEKSPAESLHDGRDYFGKAKVLFNFYNPPVKKGEAHISFKHLGLSIPNSKFRAETEDTNSVCSDNINSLQETPLIFSPKSRNEPSSETIIQTNLISDSKEKEPTLGRVISEPRPSLFLRDRKMRLHTAFEKRLEAQAAAQQLNSNPTAASKDSLNE